MMEIRECRMGKDSKSDTKRADGKPTTKSDLAEHMLKASEASADEGKSKGTGKRKAEI